MKTKLYLSNQTINKSIFSLFLMFLFTINIKAQNEGIYWNDVFGTIQKSDLDGSNIQTIMSGLNGPETLVIDEEEEVMFFTLFSGSSPHIVKANLDGTGQTTILSSVGNSIQIGLGLDKVNQKLYYPGGNGISRCDYDGTNNELIVANHPGAQDVAVDEAGGKVYWIDNTEKKVKRADLNGANVEDLVTIDINWTVEVDLDLMNNKIYWSDFGEENIKRCDLDGSSVEIVVDANNSPGANNFLPTSLYPRGIHIDPYSSTLYFLNGMEYKIKGFNVTTGNGTNLVCLPPMTSGTSVVIIQNDPCNPDEESPTAVCQAGTIALDSDGQGTLLADAINNGSTDNCTFTMSVEPSSLTCDDLGLISIALTVTDAGGNIDVCLTTWTVVDDIAPVAACKDITIEITTGNAITIPNNSLDDGSFEACEESYSLTQEQFTCDDLGANNVTMVVTDGSDNFDTCSGTITMKETVPPVAMCKAITLELDANNNATLNAQDLDNGSSDNCDNELNFSASATNFDCSHIGENMVTLSVTDDSMNEGECTAMLTIMEKELPVPVCKNITVELDDFGEGQFNAVDADNGSTDNCDDELDFEVNISTTVICSQIGSHLVMITVTDDSGNAATCEITLQVLDNISPEAICKDITIGLGIDGNLTLSNSAVNDFSTDNCEDLTYSIEPSMFSCDQIGEHLVTMTVTDPVGNDDDCTAMVTIVDVFPPVVGCKNITVELSILGDAFISVEDVEEGSEDNCSETLTFDLSKTDFDCLDIGVNTVILTAFDDFLNSTECPFIVTVEDKQAPEALCKNFILEIENESTITILGEDLDDGSFDACSEEVDIFPDVISFDCMDVGDNIVTLIITDESGNLATCEAIVSVVDVIAPNATCIEITVELTELGITLIEEDAIDAISIDNCENLEYSLSNDLFDCEDIGSHLVTMMITDPSGNQDECSATVTVVDAFPPIALCQDITVSPGSDGTVSISADDVDGGSEDNCGIIEKYTSTAEWDCNDDGSTETIFLTLTDASGNVSECTAEVIIIDVFPPEALCKDIEVSLDFFGIADISASDINDFSFDNCDEFSVTLSTTALLFGCDDIGSNAAELFVEDLSGNMSSCIATVTVQDNMPPEALCKDIAVTLLPDVYNLTSEEVNNFSADNCEIANMSVAPSFFDCGNLGNNLVTLIITDASGNSTDCTANVFILEASPIAICQDITLELDADGIIPILPENVDNGSSASCAPLILSLNTATLDCADVGNTIVTLTADNGIETDECLATVFVEDNLPPTAMCRDTFVVLDQDGIAVITPEMIDNSSWDNCGIDTIGLNIEVFNENDLGENEVVLVVVDLFENVDTCHAIVTVKMEVATENFDVQNVPNLNVFPNPVQHLLFIEYQSFDVQQLWLTDASGKMIQLFSKTNIPQTLNTASLPEGIYLLNLQDDKGNILNEKFVKLE